MGKKDGEERRHVRNQKVVEKGFPEQLPQVSFLFLKMVLALFLPQVHLSPHFLSQKVENAPVWILMKVKIYCPHSLGHHWGQVFFLIKHERFLLGSLVYIAFFGVYLSLNFPFFLTCRSPTHVHPVHLISLREHTSIFRCVYSAFPPSLENRVI